MTKVDDKMSCSNKSIRQESIDDSNSLPRYKGSPRYVPYFWDNFLNHSYDDKLSETKGVFNVNNRERKIFPELKGFAKVTVWKEDGIIKSEALLAERKS